MIPLVELTAEAGGTILEPPRPLQPAQMNNRDPILHGFESAFRNRFARAPDGWAAIGYKAASAVCSAVRDNGTDRYRIVQDLRAITPTVSR